MFKERLHKTLKFIWNEMLLPFIAFLIALIIIISIAIYTPILYKIAVWMMGIFIAFIILLSVCIFIYWLFVEPLIKSTNDKLKENE